MRLTISSSSLLLLAVFVSVAVGTPIDPYPGGKCNSPLQRKEWRTLSDGEKKSYIDAVKCLQQKPSNTTQTSPGALSRFEDFLGTHILLGWTIHYVGRFLPWHRYLLGLYEKALREECGYESGHPYWDWTLDADDFVNSPLFDPTTGFGGNGVPAPCNDTRLCLPGSTGGGCVKDGPFKGQIVHMGPWNYTGTNRNDHCLTRGFSPKVPEEYFGPAAMQYTLSQTTFEDFWPALEGLKFSDVYPGQHAAGHAGVGGTMLDFFASPGDPIFYMHHAAVDWVWSTWQSRDPSVRLNEVTGRVDMDDASNVGTTLATTLGVGLLGPEVTIADVIDTRGELLCYEYA